jgi:hypothetical protein
MHRVHNRRRWDQPPHLALARQVDLEPRVLPYLRERDALRRITDKHAAQHVQAGGGQADLGWDGVLAPDDALHHAVRRAGVLWVLQVAGCGAWCRSNQHGTTALRCGTQRHVHCCRATMHRELDM